MQMDFHYYAAYCGAYLAGYSHEECLKIAYADQFTDCCSVTLLKKIHAPASAATTQLQLELMDMNTSALNLQETVRIWSSFHFLPYDLHADIKRGGMTYKRKYRLICDANGSLVADTVHLAKDRTLEHIGIAMHILCDTWAHRYFAGVPSLVINNVDPEAYETVPDGDGFKERSIVFRHSMGTPDDLENGKYTSSLYQSDENSIMNLGHGRAGHLPDYSFAKYRYMPAWGSYSFIVKDNPVDYMYAFRQMVYALKYLRGDENDFKLNTYDTDSVDKYEKEIDELLRVRRLDACDAWKALGEKMSGQKIEDFDMDKYQEEYVSAADDKKDDTVLGKYITAAMLQKSMVSGRIYESGSYLAGIAYNKKESGKTRKDYRKLFSVASKRRKGGSK